MAAEAGIFRTISVAGISLEVAGFHGSWPLPTFPLFESCSGGIRDQWKMEITHAPLPEIRGDLSFDSGESWAGYALSDTEFDLVQMTRDGEGKRRPQGLLRIDSRKRHARLFDTRGIGLSYPFDELFFLNAFSLSSSLLVHSCATERNGAGYVFCGVSGAGKSTLGKILQTAGWNVLCDERNAVWRSGAGPFQLSSTPWYGGGEICKNASFPLRAMIALNPAHEGFSLERLSLENSIAALFPTLFLPQFSQSGIDRSLDTLKELLLQVPVLQLNYAKDSVDIAERLAQFSQGYGEEIFSRATASRSNNLSLR